MPYYYEMGELIDMNYRDILVIARKHLYQLPGRAIDVMDLYEPRNVEYAKQLVKVISKLSPMLGNMIEFATVDLLNQYDWENTGSWKRQDPGFPDAIFSSDIITPNPGIEIKTWFPLATEITARFKDSVTHFGEDQIDVALIVWLPEHLIWGKPKIIDVWIGSAASLAQARDQHYHRPPDYLVFEPEDTSDRTSNLQQTNTNGFKFQGTRAKLIEAERVVDSWGANARTYSDNPDYQSKLKGLIGQFDYRLDTNFAKIDRIEHPDLEKFKTKVLNTQFCGRTINYWASLFRQGTDTDILEAELARLI